METINDNKMVVIYKLYYNNKPNVIYIGKTEKSLNRRFYEHIYAAKNKPLLKTKVYNWIRKYGYDDLNISTICKVETQEGDFAEIEQIRIHKENGFILKNLTNGGDGVKKGYKHNKDFCEMARKRSLLDGRFKGEKNPFFGKIGVKNHKSIETHQYSLDGNYIKSFESQSLINKELCLPRTNSLISMACKTGQIAYGYLWSSIRYDKLEPKKRKNKPMSEFDAICALKLYQSGLSFSEISKKTGFGRVSIAVKLKKNFGINSKCKLKVYMSESDIVSAFEMHNSGLSIREISKRTKFSANQIKNKLKKNFNICTKRNSMSETDIILAIEMYQTGLTFKEIAKKTGFGKTQIANKLNNAM